MGLFICLPRFNMLMSDKINVTGHKVGIYGRKKCGFGFEHGQKVVIVPI